jgi:enolase-phosphatase E1
MLQVQKPKVIITDIEGTTTAITFVADELFPYFRINISDLLALKSNPIVQAAFDETIHIVLTEEKRVIKTDEELISALNQWSVADKKITPLKTLQGVLWEKGYKDGTLKGHVYADVAQNLTNWHAQGIALAVFSSGSVTAQKLLFGNSIAGDLTPVFSAYFDTKTGAKRDTATYTTIAEQLATLPIDCLFLSDITEELVAAKNAGFQTIQLVRPGTEQAWDDAVASFDQIQFI